MPKTSPTLPESLKHNDTDTFCLQIHISVNFLFRYPDYFIYTIVCPCLLILVMSLFQFLIPPESGERISFVITLLLAFSVLQFALVDKLPENSLRLPLISKCFWTIGSLVSKQRHHSSFYVSFMQVIRTVSGTNCHYAQYIPQKSYKIWSDFM